MWAFLLIFWILFLAEIGCGQNQYGPYEEFKVKCSERTVKSSGETITKAQRFLQSLGVQYRGPFSELRIEDPVRNRYYSLVLAGSVNTPISDVVVLSGENQNEWRHSSFSRPVKYLGAQEAVAATGMGLSDVTQCRLLRVQKRPYNHDLSPIWEITTTGKTHYVDMDGQVIESSYENLMKEGLGG